MDGKLTRREFLQEAASKTTVLTVASMGFGLGEVINFPEAVQCRNCASVNLYNKSYLSSLIYPKETQYCYNCGINLNTLKYDIICKDHCHCSEKNSKNKGDFPVCCQIPFPNHKYLKNTRKPDFSLKDLKF